ncbi:prepilin peptidase [Plectonema cf. radiosum LEGE 06105]|uniref:Prepilin leader peptidase/N-methyltransferase n=1 Tax=Plectonema cf. radiosum LEGE 06105 TaxID=945769 RepID=A0A8J7JXQ1_9CYAN|nr:A24 family peptidase [Plectonema radiosum]MBE9216970.1 prepilin peptidase [Plectonema cf. radiosum LEGE 06105]
MDEWIFVPASLIVFVFGASIGSFVNVVVYRLPAGLSILYPPSRCPHCLNRLKAYDNVPVFGWFWLRGRCRYCKSRISPRYPIVEAVTGLLFVLVFLVFKFSPLTIGYWLFCSWLLALSIIDIDTMTLPSELTKSGLVLGILFQMILGFIPQSSWSGLINQMIPAIAAAVFGLWMFDVIARIATIVFRKDAMGAGDAKLAAMMGAWLGWKYLLLASFIACVAGVIVEGRIIIPRKAAKQNQPFPFGPYLALGSAIALFCGEAILSSYLRFFFPS